MITKDDTSVILSLTDYMELRLSWEADSHSAG